MATNRRNPLEPMATVISVLLGLTAVVAVVAAVASIGSLLGFGDSFVYLDVPARFGSDRLPLGPWDPRADVSANTSGLRLIATEPALGQRVWFALTMVPGQLLFIGALLLMHRLLRGAEREGIYTTATAARLRTLGYFLLVGALVTTVVEMVAANRLLATMVTNPIGWLGPIPWTTPWAVLLAAVGLLTFASIMRIGADMRTDLQGTV